MSMNPKRRERLKSGLLKTGEIAKAAHLLPSCVRYYTNLGFLKVYSRTQGKYPLYKKEETLAKLRRIKSLKAQGASLDEIKKKMSGAR
jgi:DNA-binding transcriptional MerR regulator